MPAFRRRLASASAEKARRKSPAITCNTPATRWQQLQQTRTLQDDECPGKIVCGPDLPIMAHWSSKAEGLPFGMHWGEVREADIFCHLLHVARGEEAKVAAELAANPELGIATTSSFTDPAGRCFEGSISGWQYALWSLDANLCRTMLQSFEDVGGDLVARARAQCLCVSAAVLPWQREHGRIFDFCPLLRAYQEYDQRQGAWDNARRIKHWCTVIGAAQRNAPSHVLQEFCRDDRPLIPPPDFTVLDPLHPDAVDALYVEGMSRGPLNTCAECRLRTPPPPPPPSVTPAREFDGRYERRPQIFLPGTLERDCEAICNTRNTWREGLDLLLEGQCDCSRLDGTWAIVRGSGMPMLVRPSCWRIPLAVAGTSDAVAVQALAAARSMQFEQLVLACEDHRPKFHSAVRAKVDNGAREEIEAGGRMWSEMRAVCNFVMHSPRRR